MESDTKQKEFIANVLAIIGLIIVIVIALWGALHLASLSSPWVSSFLPSSTSTSTKTATTLSRPAVNTSLPSPTITKTTATPKTTPPSQTTPPVVGNLPDLTVRIVAIGVIDPSSGEFVANVPATQGLLAAVQFDIANTGTASTPVWHVSAHLPTTSDGSYSSPAQAPLAPGAHVVNTLRFSQVIPGGGIFSVAVDPANDVQESNENNNAMSVGIPGN